MKLYYNPQSRAVIAKWMLDECDAQYQIVPIDFAKREHKSPEFLKINPAGKLPALKMASKDFRGRGYLLVSCRQVSRKPILRPKSALLNAAAIFH